MPESRRTALVTGGNRGLGRAIAEGLAARGLAVTIGVRDVGQGREVARDFGAEAIEMDVSHAALLEQALGGRTFDVLVNNAGAIWEGNVFDDPVHARLSIETMLSGPYELIRLLRPGMEEARYGRIVNVSSGLGSFARGLGGGGAYGIAKAALNALTVIGARDLGPGIKINAMDPGWLRTRMGAPTAPRSAEEGADTAIWLATLPKDGPTGGFFRDREPTPW